MTEPARTASPERAREQPGEGVWNGFRAMLREHAVLGVLEAQRAGLHLARFLAAVLIVSVLGVTAWLATVGAMVAWLAQGNASWPVVLLMAAVLNAIAAAAVTLWAKRQFREMPFAATLRQLSADRRDITLRSSHAQAPRP